MGMHGPLEVFSRKAVKAWAYGRDRCVAHFNKLCSGPCQWGEDMFIDQCLFKVLNVKRDYDGALLVEDHCDPPPGWQSCKNATFVSYHPFKKAPLYFKCMGNSAKAAGSAVIHK
mmetsp:Transcript_58194/g.131135  ORF Transcript_58194/g.131135 Transcript_58194/m.131135 type:complete len:114 (-) Transcript_58194:138-479(-)